MTGLEKTLGIGLIICLMCLTGLSVYAVNLSPEIEIIEVEKIPNCINLTNADIQVDIHCKWLYPRAVYMDSDNAHAYWWWSLVLYNADVYVNINVSE